MTHHEALALLDRCTHDHKPCDLSDGHSVCSSCYNAYVYASRQARKEQLAAKARCEVERCKARGILIVAGSMLMCRKHFTRAQEQVRSLGIIGFCASATRNMTKQDLLALATQ